MRAPIKKENKEEKDGEKLQKLRSKRIVILSYRQLWRKKADNKRP
jgi:hypothetical protein